MSFHALFTLVYFLSNRAWKRNFQFSVRIIKKHNVTIWSKSDWYGSWKPPEWKSRKTHVLQSFCRQLLCNATPAGTPSRTCTTLPFSNNAHICTWNSFRVLNEIWGLSKWFCPNFYLNFISVVPNLRVLNKAFGLSQGMREEKNDVHWEKKTNFSGWKL